jgi:hypothetical protein
MSILWIAVAVALVIGLIKTSIRLLKFIFTVALIGAVLILLSSVGLLPW